MPSWPIFLLCMACTRPSCLLLCMLCSELQGTFLWVSKECMRMYAMCTVQPPIPCAVLVVVVVFAFDRPQVVYTNRVVVMSLP